MTPYYQEKNITIYCGDSREILPTLEVDTVITDPPWPDATAKIVGIDRPYELFAEMCAAIPASVVRAAIHLGCNSNPLLMMPLQERMKFFRVCWLRLNVPSRQGRLLKGSDVAYMWGVPPRYRKGLMLISGESNDTTIGKNSPHPCPRKLSHVRWLVERWSDLDDTIVDPFMGGGTTVKACKIAGRKVIGIEIEERFCEMAVKSIEQNVFNFSR